VLRLNFADFSETRIQANAFISLLTLLYLYSIGIIRFELITEGKDTKIIPHHLAKCNFSAVHSFHFAHSWQSVHKTGSNPCCHIIGNIPLTCHTSHEIPIQE